MRQLWARRIGHQIWVGAKIEPETMSSRCSNRVSTLKRCSCNLDATDCRIPLFNSWTMSSSSMIWFLKTLLLKCFSWLGYKESEEARVDLASRSNSCWRFKNFVWWEFFFPLNNNKYSGGSKPLLYVGEENDWLH